MAAWIRKPWIEDLLTREEHTVLLKIPRRGQVIQILSDPKKENDFNACIVVSDKKLFMKAVVSESCLKSFFERNRGSTVVDLKGINVNIIKYRIRPVLKSEKHLREFQLIVEKLDSPGGCKSSQYGDELSNASTVDSIQKKLTFLWRQLQIQKLSLNPIDISLQQHIHYREISSADQTKLDQIPEWRSDYVEKPSDSSCESFLPLESQFITPEEISSEIDDSSSRNLPLVAMGGTSSKQNVLSQNERKSDDVDNICKVTAKNTDHALTNTKNLQNPVSELKENILHTSIPEEEKKKPTLVKAINASPDLDIHFIEQTQGFEISEDGVAALGYQIQSEQPKSRNKNARKMDNENEKTNDQVERYTEATNAAVPLPVSIHSSVSAPRADMSCLTENRNFTSSENNEVQPCDRDFNTEKDARQQVVCTSDEDSDNFEKHKFDILRNNSVKLESLNKSVYKDTLNKENANRKRKPVKSIAFATRENLSTDKQSDSHPTVLRSPEFDIINESNNRRLSPASSSGVGISNNSPEDHFPEGGPKVQLFGDKNEISKDEANTGNYDPSESSESILAADSSFSIIKKSQIYKKANKDTTVILPTTGAENPVKSKDGPKLSEPCALLNKSEQISNEHAISSSGLTETDPVFSSKGNLKTQYSIQKPSADKEQQNDVSIDSQHSPSMSQLVELLGSRSGSLGVYSQSCLTLTEEVLFTNKPKSPLVSQVEDGLASQQPDTSDFQSPSVLEDKELDKKGPLKNNEGSPSMSQLVELLNPSQQECIYENSQSFSALGERTPKSNVASKKTHSDSKDNTSLSKLAVRMDASQLECLREKLHNEAEKTDKNWESSSPTLFSSPNNESIVSSQTGHLQQTRSGTTLEKGQMQKETPNVIDEVDEFQNLALIAQVSEKVQQQQKQDMTTTDLGDSINLSEISGLTELSADSIHNSIINDKQQNKNEVLADGFEEPNDRSNIIISILEEKHAKLQPEDMVGKNALLDVGDAHLTASVPFHGQWTIIKNSNSKLTRQHSNLNDEEDIDDDSEEDEEDIDDDSEEDKQDSEEEEEEIDKEKKPEIFKYSLRSKTRISSTFTRTSRREGLRKRKFDRVEIFEDDSTHTEDKSYTMAKKIKKQDNVRVNHEIADNNTAIYPFRISSNSPFDSNSSAVLGASNSEHEHRTSRQKKNIHFTNGEHKIAFSQTKEIKEDLARANKKIRTSTMTDAEKLLLNVPIDWSIFKRLHPNIDHLRQLHSH